MSEPIQQLPEIDSAIAEVIRTRPATVKYHAPVTQWAHWIASFPRLHRWSKPNPELSMATAIVVGRIIVVSKNIEQSVRVRPLRGTSSYTNQLTAWKPTAS